LQTAHNSSSSRHDATLEQQTPAASSSSSNNTNVGRNEYTTLIDIDGGGAKYENSNKNGLTYSHTFYL
jgi:hypothetical protein